MSFVRKSLKVIKNLVFRYKYKKCKVLSSEETLDLILSNKLSIGRFGDGEIGIMDGLGISFQQSSAKLANRLMKIENNENFLVCIPNIFSRKYLNKKLLTDEEYKFLKKNLLMNEYLWRKYFNSQKVGVCGDAELSRFYMRYKDKSQVGCYVDKLKLLWKNKRVLIVEGENSQLGVGNDLLDNAKELKRILCPAKNAFDVYDKILAKVRECANDFEMTIIALGPTATLLAYDLSKEGIWALDLGHFDIEYEWYKMAAEHKVPVKGKHVNECGSEGEFNKIDKEYKKQIIAQIGSNQDLNDKNR